MSSSNWRQNVVILTAIPGVHSARVHRETSRRWEDTPVPQLCLHCPLHTHQTGSEINIFHSCAIFHLKTIRRKSFRSFYIFLSNINECLINTHKAWCKKSNSNSHWWCDFFWSYRTLLNNRYSTTSKCHKFKIERLNMF